MYLTNLIPLFVPPTRRQFRQKPAGSEVRAQEQEQLAQERRLEQERQEREEQREQQRAERRRAEVVASAEALAGDLRRARDIHEPGYTAGLIIAAGRKARGELPEAPLSGMAAAIIRAGQVRRGEVVADTVMPQNPVAAAITISGRRARGEAVSESDAAFLLAFLQDRTARMTTNADQRIAVWNPKFAH